MAKVVHQDRNCDILDFVRVSGDIECIICGKLYYDHPYCDKFRTDVGVGYGYYIHVACDGRHLKL